LIIRALLFASLLFAPSFPVAAQESATEPDRSPAATLAPLAREFFRWRSVQQPAGGDDIPRVERPDGWLPDYSPQALETYRAGYRDFAGAAAGLETADWDIPDRVDRRLLQAAIERVHWEIEILKVPRRNPLFYIDQTLGSVFELLVISSPMNEIRARNILALLEHFPATISAAKINLDEPVRPFARAAIDTLDGIAPRLQRVREGLEKVFPPELTGRLERAVATATAALQDYSRWLESRLDSMRTAFAIGPHAYQWFLTHVALLPYTVDELLAQGRQAWSRSVAWDVLEQNRNRDLPEIPLFDSIDQQISASFLKENEIRAFLESRDLMTVPGWLKHYRNRAMPDHLAPLSFLGVADDLTSENRLDEDACSYLSEPSPDLPYFSLSAARDPRPLIIHEGVPGHYFQLALSWAQPNPVRRRYIDSSINEGIAFYVEEMLLQAGLFDFSPRSREIIYSLMRLRALRVEIDIRLAVGDFSIDQATDFLARAVPMDRESAREEAVFFAFNPGQAISYQVGKLQILNFLADAKLDRGEEFSLRHFHDFMMRNGNVPIALQRWEYLGLEDQVQILDALGGQPVTVPR
jgi:hypothetical protein